jgi:hypothetical protein
LATTIAYKLITGNQICKYAGVLVVPKGVITLIAFNRFISAAAFCCLLIGPALALAQTPDPGSTPPTATPVPTVTPTPEELAAQEAKRKAIAKAKAKKLRKGIKRHRKAVWRWQDVMSKNHSSTKFNERKTRNIKRLKRILKHWRKAHWRTRYKAKHPPNYSAWLCIHSHEGPWNAATGNGYYGGLQMDLDFMRSYGGKLLARKGTANHWTPLEQIWVAERARASGRGFYPWPNTARMCGLI